MITYPTVYFLFLYSFHLFEAISCPVNVASYDGVCNNYSSHTNMVELFQFPLVLEEANRRWITLITAMNRIHSDLVGEQLILIKSILAWSRIISFTCRRTSSSQLSSSWNFSLIYIYCGDIHITHTHIQTYIHTTIHTLLTTCTRAHTHTGYS